MQNLQNKHNYLHEYGHSSPALHRDHKQLGGMNFSRKAAGFLFPSSDWSTAVCHAVRQVGSVVLLVQCSYRHFLNEWKLWLKLQHLSLIHILKKFSFHSSNETPPDSLTDFQLVHSWSSLWLDTVSVTHIITDWETVRPITFCFSLQRNWFHEWYFSHISVSSQHFSLCFTQFFSPDKTFQNYVYMIQLFSSCGFTHDLFFLKDIFFTWLHTWRK